MTIVTKNGNTIPERYDFTVDNRDPGTTWLWLDGTGDYIEVNPYELIENAVENCKDWMVDEEGVDPTELDKALSVLKRASGSYGPPTDRDLDKEEQS